MAPEFIYQTIMDETISTHKPAKTVNLSGFREFSVLARLEGAPAATVRMEINHDNTLVTQENLQLNQSGWLNFAKSYTVFAPSLSIVLYHPSSAIKVRMTVYAGL
jgi:hypothetical protein